MAIIENPKTLELNDIQGMVTQGYSKLFQTAYFSVAVRDAAKAKQWLAEVLPEVDSADNHATKKIGCFISHLHMRDLKTLGCTRKM